MKKLLFATKNPAKIKNYKDKLKKENIKIITIKDLNLEKDLEIIENGKDAIENAKIKAQSYYRKTKMTTIGMDVNLYIKGLSKEQQPKNYIRRVNGKELTDEEMVEYYTGIIHKLGGEANIHYLHGTALCKEGKIETIVEKTDLIFLEKRSEIMTKGYPLDSITWIPKYNKFLSELTSEERNDRKRENSRKEKNMIQFILDNI